jgi:hypothetical protein
MKDNLFDRTLTVLTQPKKSFAINKMPKQLRQEGASPLMIVIGVVALLGVIASLFVGGSGSGNLSSKGSSSGYASDVIQQGVAFRDAFDMKVSQGTSPASVIVANDKNMGGSTVTTNASATVFPTNATNGTSSIFYQGDGLGAAQPRINPAAFSAASPRWTVASGVIMTGVGSGSAEYAIGITGLKSGVCAAINKTLYNTESIPVPTTSNLNTVFASGTDSVLPLGVTDALVATVSDQTTAPTTAQLRGAADGNFATSFPNGVTGWTSGCYADTTTGTNFTFIQALSAN